MCPWNRLGPWNTPKNSRPVYQPVKKTPMYRPRKQIGYRYDCDASRIMSFENEPENSGTPISANDPIRNAAYDPGRSLRRPPISDSFSRPPSEWITTPAVR